MQPRYAPPMRPFMHAPFAFDSPRNRAPFVHPLRLHVPTLCPLGAHNSPWTPVHTLCPPYMSSVPQLQPLLEIQYPLEI